MVLNTIQTLEVEAAEALLRMGVLIGLILMIAFFVAAELSLVAASQAQISQLAQQTDHPGQAKKALLVQAAQKDLQHYLSVTQTGTTGGSLLLGWLGEDATVHWIEPWVSRLPIQHLPEIVTAHLIAIVIAFSLVTYIEILLGELIPKVLASQAPEQTALALVRPLMICSAIFWPFLVVLNSNVRLLTGWINCNPSSQFFSELPTSVAFLEQIDHHSVAMPGILELTVVNQKLALDLPISPAYRTLAGFMIHHLGHLPVAGERLLWGKLELEVLKMTNGNLETILFRNVLEPLPISQLEIVAVNSV